MSLEKHPDKQSTLKRKFLFIPLKRLLPYLGLIIGILMIVFQQSLWTYTESIVGRLLIDIIRIETKDRYTITYEKVRFNIFKDQLRLTKFSVIEEGSDGNAEPDSITRFALRSSLLSLNVNSFLDVLVNREINIEGLELTRPSIRIVDKSENVELDSLEAKSGRIFDLVGKYLDNFEIKELKISNAAIDYVKVLQDTSYLVRISDISFLVKSFQIENPLSNDQQLISTSQFEFEILNDTIHMVPGHIVSFSKIKGSSADSIFRVENLRVKPIANYHEGAHLDMLLPYVQLTGFHPRDVILHDTLRSKQFQVGNGHIYLDLTDVKNDQDMTFEYNLPVAILGGIKTQRIDLEVNFLSEGARRKLDIKKLELNTSRILLNKNSIFDFEKSVRSVELNIKAREYSIDFAVPNHRITSKNIILDTRRGYFSSDELMIIPESSRAPQYKTKINNIQLWGLNIPELVINQNLKSRKILIRNLDLDVVMNSISEGSDKIDLGNIQPMLNQIFPSIGILDLQIRDSDLIIKNLATNSEVSFNDFTLRLENILIDTSLAKNQKQILGAENIILQGKGMSITSKSAIREIHSGSFYINSIDKNFQIDDVKYSSVFPAYQEFGSDQIRISKLGLYELIHNHTLIMDSLRIRRLKISVNNLDSIYIPNDQIIYTSTPEFLDSLNVGHILISDGELDIKSLNNVRIKIEDLTGIVENVNVVKRNDKLYWQSYKFYAENGPFSFQFNEANHRISGKSMIVSKSDSTLRVNQLIISPVLRNKKGNLTDIVVPNLLLTGVDLTHLLDSNLIITQKTLFINPSIELQYKTIESNASNSGNLDEISKGSGLIFMAKEVSVLNGSLKVAYASEASKTSFLEADWMDLSLKNFQFAPEISLSTELHFIDHLELKAQGVSHSRLSSLDTIYIERLQLNSEEYITGENIHSSGSNKNITFDAVIPSMRLSSNTWLKKILNNDFALDSLSITGPTFLVEVSTDSLTSMSESENTALSLIDIRLDSGSMLLTYNNNEYLIPEFSLDIDQFDLTGKYFDLFSKDFSMNIKGLKNLLPESYSTVNVDEASFSTGKKTLRLHGLDINPIFDKLDYGRELGYQTDWIKMRAEEFNLNGIDFPGILESGILFISEVKMDSVDIKIYRDKNVPFPETQVRYMPHRMIANIKFPLTIESFITNNTSILYEELMEEADSAGIVEFTNFTGGISNMTNDSIRLLKNPTLQIAASSIFMRSGNLHADLEFDLTDPEGNHNYSAYLSKMPLTNLNQILEPNVNVHVKSGTLTSMNMSVQGNRDYSIGNMRFLYNDLHFNLIGKKKGSTTSMGSAMGSFFANTFIVNRNNPKLVLVRNGDIYFERDTTKSVINYITKSTLSGVVSSIGARNNRKYIRKFNDEALQNQEKRKKRERIEKEPVITSKND